MPPADGSVWDAALVPGTVNRKPGGQLARVVRANDTVTRLNPFVLIARTLS